MNINKAFFFVLIVPMLMVGAGCTKQSADNEDNSPTTTVKGATNVIGDTAKAKIFSENQNGGFSFQYPADWDIKTNNEPEKNVIYVKASSPDSDSPNQGAEFLVWMNPPGVGYEYLNKNLGSSDVSVDGINATKDILSDETGKIYAVVFKMQKNDNAYFIKYEFIVNKVSDKEFYLTILGNIMETFKFNDIAVTSKALLTPLATKACMPSEMPLIALKTITMPSEKFQGVAISDIAKKYLALSASKADAVTAVVSSDKKQLIVDYVSCDGKIGQDANNFGMDGTVSHLVLFTESDAMSGKVLANLPTFAGSNFDAMYLPIGYIGETHNVLVNGKIIDMGAGGSCAKIYWMTINTDTLVKTNFTTVPEYSVYAKNTKMVYVTPNSCVAPPQNVYVRNIATGTEQLMKKVSGDEFISMQGVEEKNKTGFPTTYMLKYSVLNSLNSNSTASTLVLP